MNPERMRAFSDAVLDLVNEYGDCLFPTIDGDECIGPVRAIHAVVSYEMIDLGDDDADGSTWSAAVGTTGCSRVHCRGLALDALDSWVPQPNWQHTD